MLDSFCYAYDLRTHGEKKQKTNGILGYDTGYTQNCSGIKQTIGSKIPVVNIHILSSQISILYNENPTRCRQHQQISRREVDKRSH